MPTRNLLERRGRSTKLEPRTMQVLVYLASHAGEIVSGDELITAVWQGLIVGDGSVYQTINQLRQALGDDRSDIQFIQTIPKQGYRLVASVKSISKIATIRRLSQIRGWKLGLAISSLSALALLLLVVGRDLLEEVPEPSSLEIVSARTDRSTDRKINERLPNSIAVLPFDNLSPDPDNAYFAAGIHDEILNQLAKIRGINVISRTSVLRYENNRPTIPDIANELHVETILEGSVRFDGETVVVRAQLIDAATDTHLWSDQYERKFEEVFAIQAAIATSIADALMAELSPVEREGIERIPTESPAAYGLYLRFLASLELADDESQFPDVRYLDQAIVLDPDFALAYATKAYAFAYNTDAEGREHIVRENAVRALALDPTLGLAHAALAFVHMTHWQGDEAEQAFEQALRWSPNIAEVLILYSRFKRYRGEYAEAIRLSSRAVGLDPNNPVFHFQQAAAYRYAKRHDAAINALQNALKLSPGWGSPYVHLGYADIARGNLEEGLRNLRIAEDIFGSSAPNWRLAQLAHAYAQTSRREDVVRLFSELEERANETPSGAAVWALAYIALGDHTNALQQLETAITDPAERIASAFYSLGLIKANPFDDPMLNEPRFQELRDRIGVF